MKLFLPLLLSLCLASSAIAQTQTNSIPQSIADVSGSVTKWLTAFDTNSTTFSNTKLDLWTAMNYQKGINTSAEIGISYDVYRPIAVEAVFHNVGVGGDLLSYAGGVSYNFFKYDVKISGYLDFGNDQRDSRAYIEFGGRIKKALTAHSYTFLGVGLQKEFGSKSVLTPTFTLGAGVTL